VNNCILQGYKLSGCHVAMERKISVVEFKICVFSVQSLFHALFLAPEVLR
jgi:hypothetical protein